MRSSREQVGATMGSRSAPFQEQLLATKFFVPVPAHALIPRSRLTRLLNQGLQRKLTLITAPAGFGKTTLLSAWLQSLPDDSLRVAWISLDENDNSTLWFWRYVLTALDSCQPGCCTDLLAFLQAQQEPPLEAILTALI